jgi:hypothetical protein
MITSLLAQVKAVTRVLIYLFGAFIVIRLWQDPTGSGHAVIDFINSVGSFLSSAVNKLSTFIRSLGD